MARPPQDAQVRINDILAAADQLFFSQGYHATTISDIAKKMGVAQGLLYYYFKSKEELLEKLLDRHSASLVAEIGQILAAPGTPTEKMALTLSAILAMADYKNGLLLSMLYDVRNLHIKEKLFHQLEVALMPWLLKIIDEGNATRDFRAAHPDIAAEFVLVIVEALIIALYQRAASDVLPLRLQMAEAVIEKVLEAKEKTIHIRLPG